MFDTFKRTKYLPWQNSLTANAAEKLTLLDMEAFRGLLLRFGLFPMS
jgi:hypothetical protein